MLALVVWGTIIAVVIGIALFSYWKHTGRPSSPLMTGQFGVGIEQIIGVQLIQLHVCTSGSSTSVHKGAT
jgi:hypothetical protein